MSFIGAIIQWALSPRTWRLFLWWSQRCDTALKASKKERKKAVKEIEVLDGIIQQRYDIFHSPLQPLVDNIETLTELRLICEYGDYFAPAVDELKTNDIHDMVWQRRKEKWVEAARKLEKESKEMEESTPWSARDDVYLRELWTVCRRKRIKSDLVQGQLYFWTDRNRTCHSCIKAIVDAANFVELGRRILIDKRCAERLLTANTELKRIVLQTLQSIQDEWFVELEEIPKIFGVGTMLLYTLTAKAEKKQWRMWKELKS